MLLLTYHMPGDETYLEAIRSMARIRLGYLKERPQGEPGSPAWCGSRMGFLGGTIAKYRMLTGDDQFDCVWPVLGALVDGCAIKANLERVLPNWQSHLTFVKADAIASLRAQVGNVR